MRWIGTAKNGIKPRERIPDEVIIEAVLGLDDQSELEIGDTLKIESRSRVFEMKVAGE